MSKTILFIDGENFRHKIEDVYNNINGTKKTDIDLNKLDFIKLFASILKGYRIDNTIFYSAKIHYSPDSPKKSNELILRQRNLITKLKKLQYSFIIAGHVRQQIDLNHKLNKPIFKEKGVDVRIAVDLVSMACDKTIKTAILCSSDSDLQPAVNELKKRNIEIVYLGFEVNPNIGLTKTTSKTILCRNIEITDAYKA